MPDIDPESPIPLDGVALTAQEISYGFSRPFRGAYYHPLCQTNTRLGRQPAYDLATTPTAVTKLWCDHDRDWFPIGDFFWCDPDTTGNPNSLGTPSQYQCGT